MFTRKHLAVIAAAAGLGIAGSVLAAESGKNDGCAGERHASAGDHRHGHGAQGMQERHARMAERHGSHGAEHKQPEKQEK